MGCCFSQGQTDQGLPVKKGDKPEEAQLLKSISSTKEEVKIQPGQFVGKRDGSIWQNYNKVRELGSGANGKVFEAVNPLTGDRRAVKQISKKTMGLQTSSFAKFFAELNMLKRLDHPNIMRLYEFSEDRDSFYLVTEYLTGGELFNYLIEQGKLTEEYASKVAFQLLSALNYCHINGIVHRDLKPENLMRESLDPQAVIKVIDFGESCILPPSKRLSTTMGTAYYIAPEVLTHSYTEKCDMWSLGVIIFILLSGFPPFNGSTDLEITAKIQKGKYSFDAEVWSQVSGEAKDLISKLLVYDPVARLSAERALEHPWIKKASIMRQTLEAQSITGGIENLKAFTATSKLKQAICMFIAAQLIQKEEQDTLTQAFKALDRNHDGRLSRAEIIQGLAVTMSEQEASKRVDMILRNVDSDISGYIEYTEFLAAGIRLESDKNRKSLELAFKAFDLDNSGSISLDELKQVLGEDLCEEHVWKEIMEEADLDGDGEINLKEFEALVLSKF